MRIERSTKTVVPVLDTSAYADNDVLFAATEIKNAFTYAGGVAELESCVIIDKSDQNQEIDLLFFSETVTLGSVNGAINISDADAEKFLGALRFVPATHGYDLINSTAYSMQGIGLLMQAAAGSQSLWVAGVCRSGTPTYAADGIAIKLGLK